jgi:transcriptional regulator with XRE-family HTH domain
MHPIECMLCTPPAGRLTVCPMVDREPTIRSRELGEGLRQAMEHAGFSGKDAARLLGWSPSWVSRLLTGKRGCTEVEVAQFLGLCRVHGAQHARLMKLVEDQDTPGWLQQHGSTMPKQLATLIDHENKAIKISDFQATIVPGLLQTGEYARKIISHNVNVPAEEIADRVAARLARQSLFTRPRPPRFTFFVHEFVLRTPVGGLAVMSEQLHHLLRMSVRPYITIRVVPIAIGAHASMAGSFKLMEFAEFKPIVYLDSETSSLFLEKPVEIKAYQRVLTSLAQIALSEGQSKELIGSIATELYEDQDDPV